MNTLRDSLLSSFSYTKGPGSTGSRMEVAHWISHA